jgi:hypothetical protein
MIVGKGLYSIACSIIVLALSLSVAAAAWTPFSLEIGGARYIPALTSVGNVVLSGFSSVINTYVMSTSANFAGSTVCSGASVTLNGGAANTKVYSAGGLVISSTMNQIRADIILNAPLTASIFFAGFFCQPPAPVESTFTLYTSSASLNGVSGKAIWYNGDIIYNGNNITASIGTMQNPVVLVVNGNLTISGNNIAVSIYGFVYVMGNLYVNGNNNFWITGASAIQGTTSLTGTSIIQYDSGALARAANLTPYLCRSPSITSGDSATFTIGNAGSFLVTTTGYPVPTVSSSGSLPGGVSFTDNHDGTATLGGTPAAGSAGSYPLIFTATNGVSPDATQNFTLIVTQAVSTILSPEIMMPGAGQRLTLTLYDVKGRVVAVRNGNGPGYVLPKNAVPGIYLVRTTAGGRQLVKRVFLTNVRAYMSANRPDSCF